MSDAQVDVARQQVGTFNVTLNLTQQRGIQMTGVLYSDDTPQAINARIDLFQDALDRQFVKADLVSKRAQVAGHKQNLAAFKEHYQALVKKQQTKGKMLASTEKDAIATYDTQVVKINEQIDSLFAAIAAGEAELAKG